MSKHNDQRNARVKKVMDSIANSPAGKTFTAVKNTARAVANSKGGQEIGRYLAIGHGEAGNLLVLGHAAPIYPGSGSPADLQPNAPADIGSVHGPVAKSNEKTPAPEQTEKVTPEKSAKPATSIVQSHLNDVRGISPVAPEPQLAMSHQGPAEPTNSIVASHLADIQQQSPAMDTPNKQMELDK